MNRKRSSDRREDDITSIMRASGVRNDSVDRLAQICENMLHIEWSFARQDAKKRP